MIGLHAPALDIFLPLAISFFTFQQIMFLVERYRQEHPDCGFLGYASFICFFPHLIAGPIVRPREIIPQLLRADVATPQSDQLAEGPMIFLLGLAKKLVLVDTFAGFADVRFNAAAQHESLSFVEAWYAAGCYALQLYIGLAYMLNVRFPLNFRSPYQATNISDFWRRWHITVSQFLRDYVYIPLGGNRCGEARRNVNLMTTMLLGGLWHGADWNFAVLWRKRKIPPNATLSLAFHICADVDLHRGTAWKPRKSLKRCWKSAARSAMRLLIWNAKYASTKRRSRR